MLINSMLNFGCIRVNLIANCLTFHVCHTSIEGRQINTLTVGLPRVLESFLIFGMHFVCVQKCQHLTFALEHLHKDTTHC